MTTSANRSVGGESPWEIARAYPYVTVTPEGETRFEFICDAPDGLGWPLTRAIEQIAAEEDHLLAASGGSATADDDQREARALVRIVETVRTATGTIPLGWPMYYNEAHGRGRNPSAQAERVRGRRTSGGG